MGFLKLILLGFSLSLISCGKVSFNIKRVPPKAFISTWRTTTPSESITLPLRTGFQYNATVNWGDGQVSHITAFDDADAVHIYEEAGDHQIEINGIFQTIYFNNTGDKTKIISIEELGEVDWRSFNNAFHGCSELVSVSGGDVSKVINMDAMFKEARKFSQGDISRWDVSHLKSAASMFLWAETFNLPIDQWNTSSLVDMRLMFHNAKAFNGAIGNWDTKNVDSMQWVFRGASAFNQPLTHWNTSKVANMHSFAANTSFNQPLSHFDVSKVLTMEQMFDNNPAFNQDISHWDVSSVANMGYMFRNASSFNQDLSNWDVATGIPHPSFSSNANSWILPKPSF